MTDTHAQTHIHGSTTSLFYPTKQGKEATKK